MELHPFRARRERKAQEKAAQIAGQISAQIIDHLSENGDLELRVPVGQPPRKIMPTEFLSMIAVHSLTQLETRTPRFARRLVYDEVASRRASMHLVRARGTVGDIYPHDGMPELNEAGLTMVLAPVHQQDQPHPRQQA